jgi:transposase
MAKPKDVIRQIKKATRRQFSADEKIRIVLEGLRGETAISEICRREGIASSVYYKWSKAFLEAGKNGLTRAVIRDATVDEVRQLKQENSELKTSLADAILEVQRYKKSLGL